MKFRMILLALTLVYSLQGCSTVQSAFGQGSIEMDTSPATGKDLAKPKTTVDIDPALLVACAPPSDLKNNPTPADVIDQKKKDVATFSECSKRHSSLVTIVKKAFGI